MDTLKLVRYRNLLIIAGTMVLMRYFVIKPILEVNGLSLQLSTLFFILLVLATVLIAAGGYVINDYFDTRVDRINHPNRVLVGRTITRSQAIGFHMIFSLLGIILGSYVSVRIGHPAFSLLFILASGVLWFYSSIYKRQLLIGNIVVALLTAIVPLIPLIFELPLLSKYWIVITRYSLDVGLISYWVGGYAVFAFLYTLIREIIKDIEDFEGDASLGRNTVPVHFGIQTAKIIVASLIAVTLLVLIFLFAAYLRTNRFGRFDFFTLGYVLVFITIPSFVLIVKILLASTPQHYRSASLLSKLIMLFGILYTLLFNWLVM